jgi:hypothetical protein
MDFTYSQISCYKRCPLKWFFRYNLLLKPRTISKALETGSHVHHLLDVFYQSKTDSSEEILNNIQNESDVRFKESTKGMFDEELSTMLEIKQQSEQIMQRYVEMWKEDLKKYQILWTEREFAIKIRNTSGKRTQDVLRGKLDMGLMDAYNMSWLVENKTTAQSIENRLDTVDLDEQIDLYLMACNYLDYLLPNFSGVLYNVIRKKPPTIPRMLMRPAGTLSKAKDIDTTYEIYMEEILKNGLNPNDYADILAILKEKGNTFYGRAIVPRSKERIKDVEVALFYTVRRIKENLQLYFKKKDINVFCKSPNLMCSRDCSYFEMCIMHSKKADWVSYANNSYDKYDANNPNPELEATEEAF